jgi:WD40 repeat protein/serine/threonine protein kinase
MGEVWLAHDPTLDRDVAIKVLPGEFARDAERLGRFLREARLAARLDHVNTATVYQAGVDNGLAYIAMQYVDGGSLDKATASGRPMDWREGTRAIRDAAAGLAAAHKIGLVHRDVKPSNLMRTSEGIAKLVDFGLARAVCGDTKLTQKGMLLGTPAYMAPELWMGQEADVRSDVYALICTYYHLLTGQVPFDAPAIPALGYQHRYEPFPDPRAIVPDLPDAVCRVLARGSQKDPAHRPQSAAELLAELEAVLSSPEQSLAFGTPWEQLGVSSARGEESEDGALARLAAETGHRRVISRLRRSARSRTRRPVWIGMAVGAVALFLGVIVYIKTDKGTVKIEVNDPTADVEVRVEREPADGTEDSQGSVVGEKMESEDTGPPPPPAPVQRGTVKIELPDGTDDVRVFVDNNPIKIEEIEDPITLEVGPHELLARRPGFTTFSKSFSIEKGANAPIQVTFKPLPATIHQEIRCFEGHTDDVTSVAFSPDGHRLLCSSGDNPTSRNNPGSGDYSVRLWNVDTGEEIAVLKGHTKAVRCVTFSPDGRRALSTSDQTVRLWDLEALREIRCLEGHDSQARSVAFAPDGAHALSGGDGFGNGCNLIYWDLEGGTIAREWTGHTEPIFSVAVSADGRLALSGGYDKKVVLWDVQQGNVIRRFAGHSDHLNDVAFSRDARLAVSAAGWSGPKSVIVWEVESGRELLRRNGFSRAAISPDGTRLLTGGSDDKGNGEDLVLWSLPDGQEICRLAGPTDKVRAIAFSPDGRLAAAGGQDKTIRLWELPASPVQPPPPGAGPPPGSDRGAAEIELTSVLQGHTDTVPCVAFSPDGGLVASASSDKTVRLWEVATGKEILRFEGHTAPLGCVTFSPDGRRLLSGDQDEITLFWTAENGEVVYRFGRHPRGNRPPRGVRCAAISHDGTRAATGGPDGAIRVWKLEGDDMSPPPVLNIDGRASGTAFGIWSVAFSPDGQRIVSVGFDKVVRLWNADTGELIWESEGHNQPVTSVAFSSNGRRIVSSSWDATVRILDSGTGGEIERFDGHEDWVAGAVLLAEDRRLLCAGGGPMRRDGWIVIWDVATKTVVARAVGHTAAISSVALSPNERYAVSGSRDNTLCLWRLPGPAEPSTSEPDPPGGDTGDGP